MKSSMFRSLAVLLALLCAASIEACASSEDLPNMGKGSGAAFATGGALEGGVALGNGGAGIGGPQPGPGGGSFDTGGANSGIGGGLVESGGSSGTGGSVVAGGFGAGGSGGVGAGSGGSAGTGGACFLGICPASGGSGSGGALPTTDAGAHKAMCNQKLCVDPIFDCLLQGCGDAVCQIPFCVIK